jgi:hypothetical protein
MSTTTTGLAAETTSPSLSFGERLIGVFTSPRRVFESLRQHPKWMDMLLLYLVLSTAMFIPMQPVIKAETIQQGIDQIDRSEMSEEQKTEAKQRQAGMMDKMMSVPVGLGMSLIFTPLIFLFWALIVWMGYGFMAGGQLSFGQAFAATCHVALIFLLAGLVKLPLVLMKKTVHVATSLALVLPDADPRSVPFAALNTLDIFTIWAFIVLAIGMVPLARISTGKSRAVSIGIFVLLFLFTAGGAMVGTMMSGGAR